MNVISDSPLVFTLDGLFTDEECNDILSLVSPDDFKVATITMGNNEFLLDMDYRSNTRVIRDDTKLANDLYLKLVDHLPPQFKGWYFDGLNTRFRFYRYTYDEWLTDSFRKCVVRVSRKEFEKIKKLDNVYLGHENTTLGGEKSCAIPYPVWNDEVPNVLKFAKLWRPACD